MWNLATSAKKHEHDWLLWLALGGFAGMAFHWWLSKRAVVPTMQGIPYQYDRKRLSTAAVPADVAWLDQRIASHQPVSGGKVADIYPYQGDVLDIQTDSADFGGADESNILPRVIQPSGELRAYPFAIKKG